MELDKVYEHFNILLLLNGNCFSERRLIRTNSISIRIGRTIPIIPDGEFYCVHTCKKHIEGTYPWIIPKEIHIKLGNTTPIRKCIFCMELNRVPYGSQHRDHSKPKAIGDAKLQCKTLSRETILVKYVTLIPPNLQNTQLIRQDGVPHIKQIVAVEHETGSKFSCYVLPKAPISSGAEDITGIVWDLTNLRLKRKVDAALQIFESLSTFF
ncbi:unnamed protein product [Mytilus coruscus]|uniref:Uncharacterized protein n=1 Tax=Mytilus coruscus TaxID=42192 RepID=A0A6J7ZXG8_MYTCO|nr:unnamed protein product [Mytilus coruscus]